MRQISRENGKLMNELESLKASIATIITTPIGSRVWDKEFGCRLFDYIDSPVNNRLDMYAAITEALGKWQKNFRISKIESSATDGVVSFTVYGEYVTSGNNVALELEVSL